MPTEPRVPKKEFFDLVEKTKDLEPDGPLAVPAGRVVGNYTLNTVITTSKKIGRHRLTLTNSRITLKLSSAATKEEQKLLEEFQEKVAQEDLDTDVSFRGQVLVQENGKVYANLYNNNKTEGLTIIYVEGKLSFSYRDR